MPKYDKNSIGTKVGTIAIPSGRYDLQIGESEENWSQPTGEKVSKLGYRLTVAVVKPVELAGHTVRLYFNVGTEKDPGCTDPVTQAMNLKPLNAIMHHAKARQTTKDVHGDLQEAQRDRKKFQMVVNRKLRSGTTNEYNNDPDARTIMAEGKLDPELFEDIPKELQPEPSRVPSGGAPVDEDDDLPTTRQPDPPPAGSTATSVRGKAKKGDIKTCPKCDGEFPKSEIMGHMTVCDAVDEDDED